MSDGRALDNRMGGFMIAEVVKRLSENKKKLDFGLYVVNSKSLVKKIYLRC